MDVDRDVGSEHELHRVAPQHNRGTERPAQLREVPTQRAEWVGSGGEQELGQLAGDRPLA